MGVGCHFLVQAVFLTRRSNPHSLHLMHYRLILYHWATWEALYIIWSAPFYSYPSKSINFFEFLYYFYNNLSYKILSAFTFDYTSLINWEKNYIIIITSSYGHYNNVHKHGFSIYLHLLESLNLSVLNFSLLKTFFGISFLNIYLIVC